VAVSIQDSVASATNYYSVAAFPNQDSAALAVAAAAYSRVRLGQDNQGHN
jgi:hypothetical protein